MPQRRTPKKVTGEENLSDIWMQMSGTTDWTDSLEFLYFTMTSMTEENYPCWSS